MKNSKRFLTSLFSLSSTLFLTSCSNYVPISNKTSEKKLNTIEDVMQDVYSTDRRNSYINPKDYAENKISISIPINATLQQGKRSHLVVEIAKNFKCLQNNLIEPFLEFIPKDDNDPYKWSEIITTVTYKGNCLKSKQITDSLKDFIIKDDKTAKVLEESSQDFETHSESFVIISYTSNNRPEIIFAKYYSGPYDCSGFQYSIALTDKVSVSHAINKIKEFVEKNTKIVKF